MKRTVIVLRLLLTAALLGGVYSETGIWTTIMVGGLAAANELHAAMMGSRR